MLSLLLGENHNYKAKIKRFVLVIILLSFGVALASSGLGQLQSAVNEINSDVRGGLMTSILGLLGSIVVIGVGIRVIWVIMQR